MGLRTVSASVFAAAIALAQRATAATAAAATVAAADGPAGNHGDDAGVTLVTFDGAAGTTFDFYAENDPVMGGLSNSTFVVADGAGVFDGTVRTVPSLKAPGFCFLHTYGHQQVRSATGQSHLALTVRNAGESTTYEQFKVSFAADTLNPQFKSYKAGFNVSGNASDWTTVLVPFSDFTNDWSPATGLPIKKCAEDPSVCVTQKSLSDIYQFGIWAEGKEGQFHLEVQSIRAVSPGRLAGDWNNTCQADTQKSLRWNVTAAGAAAMLPFAPPGSLPADESFADAICCDPFFAPYAEPENFLTQPDVALFDKVNASGETTFFDSVCGEPLFVAPRNRTFDQWKQESLEHGWPSFRDAELVPGAITIDPAGVVYSKCGTHLGSYLPDAEGNRYCLDLACLSGQQ